MVAKAGAEQRAKADTWRGPFPFREADTGTNGIKLAAPQWQRRSPAQESPLWAAVSDHQPQERAAFLPSARFHLVLLQRPCGCQVPSALRTLLKGHSWAFLFTCLSRMWWVSRTSLLGSPCPTFAPTEFKLVVEIFSPSTFRQKAGCDPVPCLGNGDRKHSVCWYGEKVPFEVGAVF